MSTLHSKVAEASVELKLMVPVFRLLGLAGFAPMAASGATVSILQV